MPSALTTVEGVGVGRAGGELVVGRAGRVGPGAGGCRWRRCRRCPTVPCCGDEGGRAVDIADGQRAGGGQHALVSVRLPVSVREHRGVVGAEDVDGDRAGGAVGAGDVEGVGVGWSGVELVVGANWRCRSRRRRCRWRRCRRSPTVPACATKVAGLSTSLMVSVPEVGAAPRWFRSGWRCRPTARRRRWCRGC